MSRRPHRRETRYATVTLLAGLCLLATAAAEPLPLADVHLHWKWNQKEVTGGEEAVDLLRDQQVALAVVSGTPPQLALELAELAPDLVVPIYGLYRVPGEWASWYRDEGLLERVRTALNSGGYRGIGEVHMIGGFVSHWRRPTISGLFRLAAEYDVPVLVHTEFSRADYTLGLCQAHPDTRLLLAHAGAMLAPSEVQRVLDECPNVHIDLSARDPWRHRNNPMTGDNGLLLPGWRSLVVDNAGRFMIGSDPVWPVEQLNPWDEPDSGWRELPRFLAFHRRWLDDLPVDVATAIRLDNALRFWRVEPAR
ncbi:MAG: amidohydrolase family protein [Gammaproteobacteria bacterium]|nr:amidohydrolase family protein [Gammaproteobacteria bacterium]